MVADELQCAQPMNDAPNRHSREAVRAARTKPEVSAWGQKCRGRRPLRTLIRDAPLRAAPWPEGLVCPAGSRRPGPRRPSGRRSWEAPLHRRPEPPRRQKSGPGTRPQDSIRCNLTSCWVLRLSPRARNAERLLLPSAASRCCRMALIRARTQVARRSAAGRRPVCRIVPAIVTPS